MKRSDKINKIINLNMEMSNIKDIDVLLEKVLTEARTLYNADAGSIYIKEDKNLLFSYAQNETLRSRLAKNKKLPFTTFTMPITNSSIAGYVANNNVSLNIPDAYKIPKKTPYSFNSSFDDLVKYRTHSMLTVPLTNNREQVIGVLQLINAQNNDGKVIKFYKRDESYVHMFAGFAATAIERAQLTRMTIMRMISMAELRDPKETGPHVNRVAAYSVEIYETFARKNKIPVKELDSKRDVLRMAAMLHDVGKVAISDVILKKPGRFNDEEYEIMKTHSYLGARLFAEKRSEFDEVSLEVAMNHHERWDGKGYPGYIDLETLEPMEGHVDKNGLAMKKKGKEIPLFGRIVAVADVYDALSCKRVYKDAWAEEDVLKVLKEERGFQFDPEIVDAFFECYDEIKAISKRYPDTD